MGRIGFWQLLLDDKLSIWEAQKINESYDAAEIAQAHVSDARADLAGLARRVDGMSREIVMLRTALTVLTKTLKDSQAIDEKLLDARLAAAMEEAFPPPPPQLSPAETAAQQAKALADRRYTCLKCRQSVPASTTSMTADGPVCDRCPK